MISPEEILWNHRGTVAHARVDDHIIYNTSLSNPRADRPYVMYAKQPDGDMALIGAYVTLLSALRAIPIKA
jgi:hypothetical protein